MNEYGEYRPNIPMLEKVLEIIREEPHRWSQQVWGKADRNPRLPGCRTSFCFAGHASVTIAGDIPQWDYQGCGCQDCLDDGYQDGWLFTDVLVRGSGEVREVRSRAAQLLGLDAKTTSKLFNPFNTIEELTRIVDEIKLGQAATLERQSQDQDPQSD